MLYRMAFHCTEQMLKQLIQCHTNTFSPPAPFLFQKEIEIGSSSVAQADWNSLCDLGQPESISKSSISTYKYLNHSFELHTKQQQMNVGKRRMSIDGWVRTSKTQNGLPCLLGCFELEKKWYDHSSWRLLRAPPACGGNRRTLRQEVIVSGV